LSRIINNLETGTMKITLPLAALLLVPLAASDAADFVFVAKDMPPRRSSSSKTRRRARGMRR
jgi:hypothetical protein